MVRDLKVPKCELQSIIGFSAVYAGVKCPFIDKSCFYKKVKILAYDLRGAQSVYYNSSFLV